MISKAQIALLIFYVIISLAMTGCSESFTIQVHNQTDETLQIIYEHEIFIAEIIPDVVVTFLAGKTPGWDYTITAKDTVGDIIYTTTFTYDDIDLRGERIGFLGRKTIYHVIFSPESD